MKFKAAWSLLALTALLSCGHQDIDSEFVALYTDLRMASAAYGDTTPTGRMARQNLLREYGWNAEQFSIAAEQIRDNPESWNLFQTKVVDRLDSLKTIERQNRIPNDPIKGNKPPKIEEKP